MKNLLRLLFCLSLLFPAEVALAVYAVEPTSEEEVVTSKKERKQTKRAERRQKRIEKFVGKVKEKLEKKGISMEAAEGSVLDNNKFKFGALLLLGAIGLGVVAALGILTGLFSFLASLFALAGLILLVWGLVEEG